MDTVKKNCDTCFFNINHDLTVCEACTFTSTPINPYPEWIAQEKTQTKDMVNAPPHYKAHPSGVECIQITEHMNFCLGNAMKYIWRAGEKHESPLEDLNKAKWYIEREIERLKNAE